MRLKSLFRHEGGQSIVEFAIILPIFLLIVFGVIDFSRFAFYKSVMNQAARETVRLASVGAALDQIETVLADLSEPLVGRATLTTTMGTDPDGKSATVCLLTPGSGSQMKVYLTPAYSKSLVQGSTLSVSLYYRMNYLTPLGSMFGKYIDLKVLSVGRIESPPAT